MGLTISQQRIIQQYSVRNPLALAWGRFLQWSSLEDEKHHFGWVGAILTVQASVIFPGTMLAILATGAGLGFIAVAMASFAAVVITNLAALSTRYTIPVFFICLVINAATILVSLFS